MHLTSEGLGESKKMAPNSVRCPVCKVQLEEEFLHDHLNTHPKNEVINALIKLKVSFKDDPSGSVQGKDSNDSKDTTTESNATASPAFQSNELQGQVEAQTMLPATSSSHMVHLPQFLKGATPIAQFIQVPVVTSAIPNQITPPPQAPVVIYSPFVCPPGSSEPTSTSISNHPTPLVQFLNNNLMRSPYSIIQTRPGSEMPQAAPKAVPQPQAFPEGSSGHIIYISSKPDVQQKSEPVREDLEADWNAPEEVYEVPVDCKPLVHQAIADSHEQDSLGETSEQEDDVSLHEEGVTQEDQRVQQKCEPVGEDSEDDWNAPEEVYEVPVDCKPLIHQAIADSQEQDSFGKTSEQEDDASLREDSVTQEDQRSDLEDCESDHQFKHASSQEEVLPDKVSCTSLFEHQCSEERELLSPPKKRKCAEWNSLGSPEPQTADWNSQHSPRPRSGCGVTIGSPDALSMCSAEGSVRLRSDIRSPSSSPIVEERSGPRPEFPAVRLKEEIICNCDSCEGLASACTSHRNTSKQRCIFSGMNVTDNSNTEEIERENSTSQNGDRNKFNSNPACSSDSCVVKEDKLNTFSNKCPSINKDDDFHDDCSLERPGTPPCDSGPPSPYQKSLDSPSTPLNIQTDETMPPRGELSEQESIGGNSSSMWSVPAYHTTREWPSPVVSYDLTARESWPGSDVSDSEGNANAADSHPPKLYKSSPSFTNTLQPFIAKASSNDTFVDKSPFSSHIQPVADLDASKKTTSGPSKKLTGKDSSSSKVRKAPTKPRVYRCKECSSEFSSLKLRRLHPCDQVKNNVDVTSISVMRVNTDVKGISDDNISVPGSSSRGEDLGVQPKPKKKYVRKPKPTIKKEVAEDLSGKANEQYNINKLEPEDSAGTTLNSQPLPDPSVPEVPSFELVDTALSFEVDPLKLPPPDLQCKKCEQAFQSAKLLYRHMCSSHRGKKYQCGTCGDTFEEESSYYEHLMIHPLECQLCGKTFMRRKYLTLHMKWHMETKPHKCETCGKSFVTRQKLDEHLNTHTGNAPIKCSDCDKSFKRYSNLIQHRNRYHLNIKPKTKDYVCQCGEVLPTKKKLEWHKEIHDDKPKSCQYCSEKFIHTASLTRHVRRAHDRRYVPKKGRESENIECPVCRLVFLKSSLASHMKIHSGERPFPCHICGKDFTTKWNLQLHRWTHASRSARPFKCTQCKSSFCRKPDYLAHMHSHGNVRPYTCNHCGCQFVRKSNCIRHMKEHEESKNYVCTICNKTFHRGYYLKDHMRVHSGTRPFTCHICGKASTCKSNHNKHVRIHHAREPQNTEI